MCALNNISASLGCYIGILLVKSIGVAVIPTESDQVLGRVVFIATGSIPPEYDEAFGYTECHKSHVTIEIQVILNIECQLTIASTCLLLPKMFL